MKSRSVPLEINAVHDNRTIEENKLKPQPMNGELCEISQLYRNSRRPKVNRN